MAAVKGDYSEALWAKTVLAFDKEGMVPSPQASS